jgi:hypothetical protein
VLLADAASHAGQRVQVLLIDEQLVVAAGVTRVVFQLDLLGDLLVLLAGRPTAHAEGDDHGFIGE